MDLVTIYSTVKVYLKSNIKLQFILLLSTIKLINLSSLIWNHSSNFEQTSNILSVLSGGTTQILTVLKSYSSWVIIKYKILYIVCLSYCHSLYTNIIFLMHLISLWNMSNASKSQVTLGILQQLLDHFRNESVKHTRNEELSFTSQIARSVRFFPVKCLDWRCGRGNWTF